MSYVFVVFLGSVFITTPLAVFDSDLDGGIRWASNYLIHLDWSNAKLLPHTNGAYFFLKFPVLGQPYLLLSVLFDFLVKCLLGFYVLELVNEIVKVKSYLLLVLFYMLFPLDFLVISLVFFSCVHQLKANNVFYFIPASFVIATSFFIKGSIAFPALVIYVMFLILLLFNKRFIAIAQQLVVLLIFLFIHLYVIYGNVFEGFQLLLSAFKKSTHFASDQSIYFVDVRMYLLFSFGLMVAIFFLLQRRKVKQIYILLLPALFVVWKYAIGRQDFGHYSAWYFMIVLVFGLLIIFCEQKTIFIGSFACVLSLAFYNANMSRVDDMSKLCLNLPRADFLFRNVFQGDALAQQFNRRSTLNHFDNTLSQKVLYEIGQKEVDVFPWRVSLLSQFDLNFKARPNIHSTLLGQEADFNESKYFASCDAPEIILWHSYGNEKNRLLAHNNYYLPNAIPESFKSIINNYKLNSFDGDIAVWQKKLSAIPLNKKSSKKIKVKDWLNVSTFADNNASIFARVSNKTSFWNQVVQLVYKPVLCLIQYRLENGEMRQHYISREQLNSNFLVQPYFINPALDSKKVSAIRILGLEDTELFLTLEFNPQKQDLNQ